MLHFGKDGVVFLYLVDGNFFAIEPWMAVNELSSIQTVKLHGVFFSCNIKGIIF